jgi:hypothetical protein
MHEIAILSSPMIKFQNKLIVYVLMQRTILHCLVELE